MAKLTRGERFKDARTVHNQHKKQTMDEVAAATGLKKSLIQALEDDDNIRSVGYDKITKLAVHYHVTTDYLLGLSDEPNPLPAAVDDLGLSPVAINWLQSFRYASEPDEDGHIYRDGLLHVANVLFENRHFQYLVENLCNMIDAVEAKRLFDAVPFGTSYDAAIQEINTQHSHSESVLDYLKAQNMLSGSNIPDAITDAFMFGFDVTDVVSHKVSQSFNTLLADIRDSVETEKDAQGRCKNG